MTIREMIEALETLAQEHGDETYIGIDRDAGIEDVASIDFHAQGTFWGGAWCDMVVIE